MVLPNGRESWKGTLLRKIKLGEAVYFVHSFMDSATDSGYRIADCLYGGRPVSAAIGRGNIFGCQFHPETGGEIGFRILKSFTELRAR